MAPLVVGLTSWRVSSAAESGPDIYAASQRTSPCTHGASARYLASFQHLASLQLYARATGAACGHAASTFVRSALQILWQSRKRRSAACHVAALDCCQKTAHGVLEGFSFDTLLE